MEFSVFWGFFSERVVRANPNLNVSLLQEGNWPKPNSLYWLKKKKKKTGVFNVTKNKR